MKHSFNLMCLVASFIGTNLLAQGINTRTPSLNQMLRPWEAGPLTLDEFQGKAKADTTIYNFGYTTRLTRERQKIGNTTYNYPKFISYFDQTESWINPRFRNDAMLKFNQNIFDLVELYTRRATIDYNMQNTYSREAISMKEGAHYIDEKIGPEEVQYFYRRELQKKVDEMEVDTRKGTDASKLPYYAADIALDLERTYFDPEKAIENATTGLTGELYIGASASFPKSDYFTSAYGINMGLSFGYNRHLWSLDMSFGFTSDAKQDIETSKGWILEDDDINYLQGYLTYAFCNKRTSYIQTFPFAGIGVHEFSLPKENKDDDNDRPTKTGFSLCAGMMFDIILQRNVSINPNFSNNKADVTYHAIRIKPYFSMTRYNDLGWNPAINLCITYNFGGYSLK